MSRYKDKDSTPYSELKVCIVGDYLKTNKNLIQTLKKHFRLPIIFSPTGIEQVKDGAGFTTIFILEDFGGDIFQGLLKAGQRIFGPTAVIQYANKGELTLPNKIRPIYTTSMENVVVTLSGFRIKEEMSDIIDKIHHMGGAFKEDLELTKTSHLIATSLAVHGKKYQFCASAGIPIMTVDWVEQAWENKQDVNSYATNEDLMSYRMLPFVGCKIAFIGYQETEKHHMMDICIKLGGKVREIDEKCTHIVVDNNVAECESFYRQHLLRDEWFWACVLLEARALEEVYIFPNSKVGYSLPAVSTTDDKSESLDSVEHDLAIDELESCSESSNYESFLDSIFSPSKTSDYTPNKNGAKSEQKESFTISKRFFSVSELCQTEKNYVDILSAIITVFMEPLQNDKKCSSLLAPIEFQIIFGNLVPIYVIHQKILQDCEEIIHNWSEDQKIGYAFGKNVPKLFDAYSPFVNFFEKTVNIVNSCAATKPRFHAFLKMHENKEECRRQTLQELLIRPVQRLPSVCLLLEEILKHTSQSDPDHVFLTQAIIGLKHIIRGINEAKRCTDEHLEMFDIVNKIKNCPPNLLSSRRKLVSKVKLKEVTDVLNAKGGSVTMFIFTDVLEISKKCKESSEKDDSFTHLLLINLSQIKKVVDVKDTNEYQNTFGVVYWCNHELNEIMIAFELEKSVCKSTFICKLMRQIDKNDGICKVCDTEEGSEFHLEPKDKLSESDNAGNVLLKAYMFTKSRFVKANASIRTVTKRGLRRVGSTIISPLQYWGTANDLNTSSSLPNITEAVKNVTIL